MLYIFEYFFLSFCHFHFHYPILLFFSSPRFYNLIEFGSRNIDDQKCAIIWCQGREYWEVRTTIWMYCALPDLKSQRIHSYRFKSFFTALITSFSRFHIWIKIYTETNWLRRRVQLLNLMGSLENADRKKVLRNVLFEAIDLKICLVSVMWMLGLVHQFGSDGPVGRFYFSVLRWLNFTKILSYEQANRSQTYFSVQKFKFKTVNFSTENSLNCNQKL